MLIGTKVKMRGVFALARARSCVVVFVSPDLSARNCVPRISHERGLPSFDPCTINSTRLLLARAVDIMKSVRWLEAFATTVV